MKIYLEWSSVKVSRYREPFVLMGEMGPQRSVWKSSLGLVARDVVNLGGLPFLNLAI